MLLYLQMLDTPEKKSKFETLYHTYRRTMLHIAMRILKDHQLAEDYHGYGTTQDAHKNYIFLSLQKKLH